ncbi:MORN domain-containing protein [Cephalotus follicularis]|uniref:MORN domain-containing protein n=1 Tax=Cephalotus follicularis TaxID=3775 RepID=A0A1Q3CHR6_CEPFO|nr:MORN domain-containing protein [Cephalotus follicularis]
MAMEVGVLASFNPVYGASLLRLAPKSVLSGCFFHPRKAYKALIISRAEKDHPSFSSLDKKLNNAQSGEIRCEESEFVQVIGIGSRKDALFDFCLSSPLSSFLRFWNIVVQDSLNVQLRQRFLQKDHTPMLVEASLFAKSCPKAIILVVSAGYGSDDVIAIDILKMIRSANGFVVAIVLKPFIFEGKRRQDEVTDLLGKLQEHTNFFLDIDSDALLKNNVVTLNEALKTANSAVLLAINAISVLISILESYKESKVGFGAGYNIKSVILQAIKDCPFVDAGVKDLNGIVICIVASSSLFNDSDLHAFLHTFRQTAKYTKEILISTIHEPSLDPNFLVTTVVFVGCLEQAGLEKSTILSILAKQVTNSPESRDLANGIAAESITAGFYKYSEEFQIVFSSNDSDINDSWNEIIETEPTEFGSSEAMTELTCFYDQFSEGHKEPLNSWNLGPGYQIPEEWAKEMAADRGGTQMTNNLSIFHLPVGVRPSEELKDGVKISYAAQHQESRTIDEVKLQPLVNSSVPSWSALTDVGVKAMRDFYDTASTVIKKKISDLPKKQGVLSARAASMLEAERDSPKKWNPIVEMQYGGGVYRGRCQGGLPEGKGCLIHGDGSIYDGTWRHGKRSGQGTYYFSNGDVLHGSWRDDLMHGKGWLYFHTGDRWFANFWKGKANGEGRFYSKSGNVFFGQFQDGLRHGHFLCIEVDGARFIEMWDEGILKSRNHLDN